MITQELIKYIESQLKTGKTKEHVANILLKKGWQVEDVRLAFSVFKEPTKGREFVFAANSTSNLSKVKNKNNINQSESYEWASKIFAFLPLVLVVQGGLGIAIGLSNIIINLIFIRNDKSTVMKFILILAITVSFTALYFAIDFYFYDKLPQIYNNIVSFNAQKLISEFQKDILNSK